MNTPAELKYTLTHEWIRSEPDGTLAIGITDHAQESLGDLVFIELPQKGRRVTASEACGVVESVKAASDIYAPVAGEILEVNAALVDAPEKANADAYASWLFKLKPDNAADVARLLDAAAYVAAVGEG